MYNEPSWSDNTQGNKIRWKSLSKIESKSDISDGIWK